MNWIDWLLFAIPVAVVVLAALMAQRYVHGVADFLSAGRVARRYVLCVASGEAALGLVSVAGSLEVYYNSGFAYGFWGNILGPLGMALGLVGFCNYRFRETRAMTLGQFFEMRYSRPFRTTASFLQAFYGVLNYAIFPAVSARFLMYFMRLPVSFTILGFHCSTFAALMLAALALACFVACAGGQITIMVTDCIQGILSYPIYLAVVVWLLWRFSWSEDLLPALCARPEGSSFLNPFDAYDLRDFNVFYVCSGVLGLVFNRLTWGSRGYDSAARDAHEAKMGSVLGTWRWGFCNTMFVLLGVIAYSFHNSPNFARESAEARAALAAKAYEDVAFAAPRGSVPDGEAEAVHAAFAAVGLRDRFTTQAEYRDLSDRKAQADRFREETADPYLQAASDALGGARTEAEIQAMPDTEKALWASRRSRNQTFATIFAQQRVPATIRAILPTGLVGLFCALAAFLTLSTDTTCLHGWASVIVQDCILPLRKRPWTPRRQIWNLRIAICAVAAAAFAFSWEFGQVDFIFMFFSITGAIWTAAGPVITLGLYWRRGTTQAAFISLLVGASAGIAAIVAQKLWVPVFYPWIASHGWGPMLDAILRVLSSPFEPWVHWELTPDKFPINSVEVGVANQLFALLLYVAVSLATCRKPFDMDRLLHRGKWADAAKEGGRQVDSGKVLHPGVSAGVAQTCAERLFTRIIGIDRNYTHGDKALAWSVFLYSFGWGFCVCFLGNVAWHFLGETGIVPPQSESWWGAYFFAVSVVVSCIVGAVSTVWFGICSTRDLLRLFRDLEERERAGGGPDVSDDGRVER